MGPIISVFIMVLVISILAGLTFLFIASLKNNTATQATIANVRAGTTSVVGEAITAVTAGNYTAAHALGLRDTTCSVVAVYNASTAGKLLAAGNYTFAGCKITNLTSAWFDSTGAELWAINYTYDYLPYTNAELSINGTESAGITVVNYLPLIFLAVIFGALLTLVLKIVLPYINLGNQFGTEM